VFGRALALTGWTAKNDGAGTLDCGAMSLARAPSACPLAGLLTGLYPNATAFKAQTSAAVDEIMIAHVNSCSRLKAWYKEACEQAQHIVRPSMLNSNKSMANHTQQTTLRNDHVELKQTCSSQLEHQANSHLEVKLPWP
jgi:hypothetical protein